MDADKRPLYSRKLQKRMERDIVQFVCFNNYKSDPLKLAEQTLEEIPQQLISYMTSKNIKPKREILTNIKNYNFFEEQKMEFTKTLVEMGFCNEKIKEMLTKGLPEKSTELFKIHAYNPYFKNALAEGQIIK